MTAGALQGLRLLASEGWECVTAFPPLTVSP